MPLVVFNSRQIRDFVRATGRLAKTDTLDAEVIVLFAERIQPEPRPEQEQQAADLGERLARRRQIVEMIGMECNRRRQAQERKIPRNTDATLEGLTAQLAVIDDDIDGAVKVCPASRQGYRIWPMMDRAKSSDHPARLRFREIGSFGRAFLSRFRVRRRRMARFSGPLSARLRAASSSKVTSSTQCRLFSMLQWDRTARANSSALSRREAR